MPAIRGGSMKIVMPVIEAPGWVYGLLCWWVWLIGYELALGYLRRLNQREEIAEVEARAKVIQNRISQDAGGPSRFAPRGRA